MQNLLDRIEKLTQTDNIPVKINTSPVLTPKRAPGDTSVYIDKSLQAKHTKAVQILSSRGHLLAGGQYQRQVSVFTPDFVAKLSQENAEIRYSRYPALKNLQTIQ